MMSEFVTIYHVSPYWKTRHKKFAYSPKQNVPYPMAERCL
jgi:hypothetical protein